MDWFVILGPLLVLGIVALLGFAGCSFEGGTLSPWTVTLRTRVPTAINVLGAGFVLDAPSTPPATVQVSAPTSEAGFNVYEHVLTEPEIGTWQVTAAVRAGAAGNPVNAEATTPLLFDYTSRVAEFEASGDPAQGTFRVDFISFVQQV